MASQSNSAQKSVESRSKSCETVCSTNSSCFLQRRKPIHPLASSLRSSLTNRTSSNTVRQRVLSAKLLKLKSVQNQLNDANFHLAEVVRENQALKTLQKRQDKALSKYEGTNAELPKILLSHEEEIRVLKEKNKQLRKNVKELNEQLRMKDDELNNALEQLKHLNKLNKDKHLMEREKLNEQLEDLKSKLEKADEQINLQNRRLILESKTAKHKLNSEIIKHKSCQKELSQASAEINRLTTILQSKDKLGISPRKQFGNNKSSTSLISLNDEKKTPVTDVKVKYKKDTIANGILSSPTDNIKARLSADSLHHNKSIKENELISNLNNFNLNDSDFFISSRPNSSQKLEKMPSTSSTSTTTTTSSDNNHKFFLKRFEEINDSDEIKDEEGIDEDSFSKHLNEYRSELTKTSKTCNDSIENHKESLNNVKSETEKLLKSLKTAENMEMNLFNKTNFDFTDNNDFVNQILREELTFRRKSVEVNDKIIKKQDSTVTWTDKKKLLETLRKIDNGENVDSFESNSTPDLMKDILGDNSND